MRYAKQASKRNTATDREIVLAEEEIADVSLAGFRVFDPEKAAAPKRGREPLRAAGGCGCSVGCGCSRGCGS